MLKQLDIYVPWCVLFPFFPAKALIFPKQEASSPSDRQRLAACAHHQLWLYSCNLGSSCCRKSSGKGLWEASSRAPLSTLLGSHFEAEVLALSPYPSDVAAMPAPDHLPCWSGFWAAGWSFWLNFGPVSLLQSCLAIAELRLALVIVTGRALFLLLIYMMTACLPMHRVSLLPSAPASPSLAEQPFLASTCHFPPMGNIHLWGSNDKIYIIYHISTAALHLSFAVF